jgi:hypothetical protein
MLSITTRAAVGAALNAFELDVDLRAPIGRRAWHLYVEENQPLRDDVKIVVVEGGDTPKVINETVGFPITGDHPEDPRYEWIEDHGLWFEIAYARGGQPRLFIFVENNPGTELGIHWLCLAYFWRVGDLEI